LVGEYIKFSPREMMDLAYVGIAVAYNLARATKMRLRADCPRRRSADPDQS
jgi:hypothetical protein